MADFNNITLKDFNSICRFCLKKDVELNPIFKDEHNGGDGDGFVDFFNDRFNETPAAQNKNGIVIVDMINLCTGLEVNFHNFFFLNKKTKLKFFTIKMPP